MEFFFLYRDGSTKFFDDLHSNNIPLLIFSAGIGDVIHEVLSINSHVYDNMHVVSNDMDFDENVSSLDLSTHNEKSDWRLILCLKL